MFEIEVAAQIKWFCAGIVFTVCLLAAIYEGFRGG